MQAVSGQLLAGQIRAHILELAIYHAKHHSLMTTGRQWGCCSMGNAAAPAGAVGPLQVYGSTIAADAAAEPPAQQDLPGTMGWPGAAVAEADFAEAAVTSEGFLA